MSAAAPVLQGRRWLWLAWLGKEWRAQHGTLLAYLALAFPCLAGGLLLRSRDAMTREHEFLVLALFVGMGALGAVAFAAPLTVRGEFPGKDDQFLRRLPGALGVAAVGKLVFLLLASIALPIVGLLAGEAFVAARGQGWVPLADLDLGRLGQRGGEPARAGFLLLCSGLGLAAVPWVMAVATWLPGGRMALGGLAVLVTAGAVGIGNVLGASPGLAVTLGPRAWLPWLCWLVPLGALVAHVSLVRGRRGGGPEQSARWGGAAAFLGLLPMALWLASWVRAFHWPRVDRLADLTVLGVTPDTRFALVRAAEDPHWAAVPMRIDLQGGTVELLGGVESFFTNEILKPWTGLDRSPRRFWRVLDVRRGEQRVFDTTRGVWHDIVAHADGLGLGLDMREALADEVRETTPFRAPGGRRAWVLGRSLHIETDGGVDMLPWTRGERALRDAGHGILVCGLGREPNELYDLTRRAFVPPPGAVRSALCVAGFWLLRAGNVPSFSSWQLHDPARGATDECKELRGCELVGLWDDEEVVAVRRTRRPTGTRSADEVFTFRLRDRRVTSIDLPERGTGVAAGASLDHWGGTSLRTVYGLRDRRGRLWLTFAVRGADGRALLAVDPATRVASVVTVGPYEVIAFPDTDSVLLLEGKIDNQNRIVRLDYERRRRTVLFPRHERAATEAR